MEEANSEQAYTLFSEFGFAVLGAEVRVDDIEVGYGDVITLRSEVKSHIDRDVGLARAVVTAEYG